MHKRNAFLYHARNVETCIIYVGALLTLDFEHDECKLIRIFVEFYIINISQRLHVQNISDLHVYLYSVILLPTSALKQIV